jgi:DNA-binding NtrC family response regulator
VKVPPLRDRAEDVAPIADAIVRALGRTHDRPIPLSRAAKVALAENAWPGNVRQLENAIARGWAVALSENAMSIEPKHLFPNAPAETTPDDALAYDEAMRRFQARFLKDALEKNAWNVSETARRIGVARSHLNDLVKAHGLARKR